MLLSIVPSAHKNILSFVVVVVQSLSCVKFMDYSMAGFPVLYQFLELAQTHVY